LLIYSLQAVLTKAKAHTDIQGIPDTIKYHGGWKRWNVNISGSSHSFDAKGDAVSVARWQVQERRKLESIAKKNLSPELQAAGLKLPRSKDEAVESVIRLRYKALPQRCQCCLPAKAHSTQIEPLIFSLYTWLSIQFPLPFHIPVYFESSLKFEALVCQ